MIFDSVMCNQLVVVEHMVGPAHDKSVHSVLNQKHGWGEMGEFVHGSGEQGVRK